MEKLVAKENLVDILERQYYFQNNVWGDDFLNISYCSEKEKNFFLKKKTHCEIYLRHECIYGIYVKGYLHYNAFVRIIDCERFLKHLTVRCCQKEALVIVVLEEESWLMPEYNQMTYQWHSVHCFFVECKRRLMIIHTDTVNYVDPSFLFFQPRDSRDTTVFFLCVEFLFYC